jgi:predicted RNA-binding protein (virulence factor B family)
MYQNQIRPGDRMKGFIKSIRADGKVDVSLQKSGFENIEINAQIILDMLKKGRGYLRLHDKSSSEDIKTVLQMSKKTFKKSIGTLYKDKIIDIKEDGIYLL